MSIDMAMRLCDFVPDEVDRAELEGEIRLEDLSPRQQDVLMSLAKGNTNQEIATDLGLKLSTVRNNMAAIFEILGFNNRIQALLWVLSQ